MSDLTGDGSGCPAGEPKNSASPKANTPPSAPMSQYPLPDGVAVIDTIGAASFPSSAALPKNTAPPKPRAPPSEAASQDALPAGVRPEPPPPEWVVGPRELPANVARR